MTPRTKLSIAQFIRLFLIFLLTYGIALPVGILLLMPLVKWMITGVLYFPVSAVELLRVLWAVIGMSLLCSIVIWIEGKIRGRY